MDFRTAGRFQDPVAQFKVYEDYLDSRLTPADLFYLKSRDLARKLVEHGHRGTVLTREEFRERWGAAQEAPPPPPPGGEAAGSGVLAGRRRTATLASAGKELKDNFLRALAEREEANRTGKMTSVIFIRDHNTAGQEVSGYIDYAHRLQTQDFQAYFSGKKRLMPGRLDLCYYNWSTQTSSSNSSPNYQVLYHDPDGLLFRSKWDKKVLSVDPESSPGEDSRRTSVESDLYAHVVIYDHNVRTL